MVNSSKRSWIQFPLGPGQADDVANVVLFLLSPQGSYVAGTTIFIDGAHDAMMRPDANL